MNGINDQCFTAARGAGVTMSNRPGDRPVPIPRDLPGVVIFIHGVNDPGAAYATVERGLCQGLNERLSRSDLRPGEYGRRYAAASAAKAEGDSVRYAEVLGDPDMYLYRRAEAGGTHSMFLPFYWGYRASDNEIAKISHPGEVKSRVADSDGNLMTRGQYQDIHGNRLDAHFGKGGGFFANATNNIPQMYSPGFEPDKLERTVMQNALAGNTIFAGKSPERRYFVLAAARLANLIKTIRTIQPSALALEHGMDPQHETITVMGHSQGTIITLLAQAMLRQQGQRCVDCIIMVDTPYSLQFTQDGSQQTGHAKLKTLVDIVNAVTSEPHTIPELAELMIDSAHSCGRAGQNWSKTQGKRPDKGGKHWITFDERDNRGKVYLYFCPEDTVVGLDKVRGIGTFGVPDEVPADGAAASRGKTMPAMTVLEPKRFFQRMWTRLERDQDGRGKRSKVAVGTPPARVPVRDPFQRLTPGPDTDGTMLGTLVESGKNMALQASFKRNDIRFINGEQLKPAYEPDLYGGEVRKGGQVPGHADVAGLMRPDDVTKNVALGNQYAKFKWKDVATTDDPGASIEPHKQAFNRGRPVDEQSHNWRIVPSRSLGSMLSAAATGGRYQTYVIQREETPDEVRKRMRTDADQLEANNYHSGVLLSSENHRWVTAMDVAIGQAVTLDDPDWRQLLLLMADWKMTSRAFKQMKECKAFNRLDKHTRDFLDACSTYYRTGQFPAEKFVMLTLPPLVTSELKAESKT
ncbi:Type V secretory pathway, adhesin AidA [Burkholderia pseudomallei]|nr:Type V secretory pathway, adhesin AidA [Burkholderia pseudomallei]